MELFKNEYLNRISNEYNETKIWFKLTEFLEFIRKTQYKRRLLEFWSD